MASMDEKIKSSAGGAKNTNAEGEVGAGGLPKSSASPTASQENVEDAPGDAAVLHGFRLYTVATGVYFGALMMSLDISIIGTVPNYASLPPPSHSL